MLLQRDPPVDWKEILLDFVRWGWTLASVCEAINVPRSTLKGWWYGTRPEPRFDDGRALLKLYEQERKRRACATEHDDSAVQTAR